MAGKRGKNVDLGVGGLFKGLADLVERLGELAETGEELKRTGEIRGGGKEVKGVYGFSVKVGLGDEGVKVEPFGNIARDEQTDEAVVRETREPIVDVFEESDHILVVAEMPGIGPDDLRIEVKDDILTLSAEKGTKRYRKEILLPRAVQLDKTTISCNNGIVEVKCLK